MNEYTEHGFYHPDIGYWQTIGAPSESEKASYPQGTVEIPLKPGSWYDWDGTEWIKGRMPEDLAAGDVRWKRSQLLTESDWAMNPDTPTDKEAWGAYRQALRDITAQEGFPYDIVWPVKPT